MAVHQLGEECDRRHVPGTRAHAVEGEDDHCRIVWRLRDDAPDRGVDGTKHALESGPSTRVEIGEGMIGLDCVPHDL